MTDDSREAHGGPIGGGGPAGGVAQGTAPPKPPRAGPAPAAGASGFEGWLRAEVVALSSCGPVRETNEDRLGWAVLGMPGTARSPEGDGRLHRVELTGPMMAVVMADGLGGHAYGEVASAMAVATVLDRLAAEEAPERLPAVLREAFDEANLALLEGRTADPAWLARGPTGRFDPESAGRVLGAQTTLTALVLGGRRGHLAHVGDCRALRLRDGVLELLTTDHTQAMELVRMRLIRPDQAARHPGRHLLTRSIGGDPILRVESRSPKPAAGDTFLIATDGLWSAVTSGEVRSALEGDLAAGIPALVATSVERGGDDNASVIAVRVLDPGGPREAEATTGWRLPWRRSVPR